VRWYDDIEDGGTVPFAGMEKGGGGSETITVQQEGGRKSGPPYLQALKKRPNVVGKNPRGQACVRPAGEKRGEGRRGEGGKVKDSIREHFLRYRES